jgi:hypothetical protein
MVKTIERYAKPPVGAKVRVVTKWPDAYYWRKSDWRYDEYVGTVVRDPNWAENAVNTFELKDDVPSEFPVHTIPLHAVDKLVYLDGRKAKKERIAPPKPNKSWVITSAHSGKQYTVTNINGQYKCTCPGFGFRRHCKHIDEVKNEAV